MLCLCAVVFLASFCTFDSEFKHVIKDSDNCFNYSFINVLTEKCKKNNNNMCTSVKIKVCLALNFQV